MGFLAQGGGMRRWFFVCTFAGAVLVGTNASASDLVVRTIKKSEAIIMPVTINGRILKTDLNGKLRETGLQPGRYDVSIGEGENILEFTVELKEDQIIYLSAVVDSSGHIRVGSRKAPLKKDDAATGEVSLSVKNSSGTPLENAACFLADGVALGQTNSKGLLTFGLKEGQYEITVSQDRYDDVLVSVDVVAGMDLTMDVLLPDSDSGEGRVEEVIVRAEYQPSSSLTLMRDASAVVNVLDIEDISRVDESSIAGALTKVSAVSLEDNRFAVVRGLKGRYVSTTINNAAFGGTDPYRRDISLDLFPSFILTNIEVQKSFSANKSGESTAANININTPKIPDSGFLKYAFSTTQIDSVTGKSAPSHYGSESDWLGRDDGLRDRPDIVVETTGVTNLGSRDLAVINEEIAESFLQRNEVTDQEIPWDLSTSVNTGSRWNFGGGMHRWGFVAGLKYSNNWDLRHENLKQVEDYTADSDDDPSIRVFRPFSRGTTARERSSNNVEWGGIFTLSAEFWESQQVTWNTVWVRDAEKVTSVDYATTYFASTGDTAVSGPDKLNPSIYETGRNVVLQWTEREAVLQQLLGDHSISAIGTSISWQASRSSTTYNQPDRIAYRFMVDGTARNSTGNPVEPIFDTLQYIRSYENLDDELEQIGIQVEQNLFETERFQGSLAIGGGYLGSERGFRRYTYGIALPTGLSPRQSPIIACGENCDPYALNPNDYLRPATFGANYFFEDLSNEGPTNIGLYDADYSIRSRFATLSFSWIDRLDLSVGRREEIFHQGILPFAQDKVFAPQFVEEPDTIDNSIIDSDDSLRALNLTFYLPYETQYRFAYSETVARPSLTEAADGAFNDTDLGVRIYGNPNIKITEIKNYDYRIEHYFSTAESVSLAYFRKYFVNPIELAHFRTLHDANVEEYTYANADSGHVEGVEVEAVKTFSVGDGEIFANSNFTLVDSELVLGQAFDVHQVNAEDEGDSEKNVRQMSYQPDSIFNFTIGYDYFPWDFSATLTYNRTGEKYSRILDPDLDLISEDATENVKLLFQKKIQYGVSDIGVSFSINNLLESEFSESIGDLHDYRVYDRGRAYKLKLSAEI